MMKLIKLNKSKKIEKLVNVFKSEKYDCVEVLESLKYWFLYYIHDLNHKDLETSHYLDEIEEKVNSLKKDFEGVE